MIHLVVIGQFFKNPMKSLDDHKILSYIDVFPTETGSLGRKKEPMIENIIVFRHTQSRGHLIGQKST